MRKKKCKDCQGFFPHREFVNGTRKRVCCRACHNKRAIKYYHQSKGRTQPKPLGKEDFLEENRMAIVRLGEQRHRILSRKKEPHPEPIQIAATR